MSSNYRLKILLVKNDVDVSDRDLIKTDDLKLKTKDIYGDVMTKLYYKYSGGISPSWYRNYLLQDSNDLRVHYASGLIFRSIDYNEKNYRFAITFGGADSMLNTEYFEPRFGLKIALNLADKIFSISKSSISTTMARLKETAIQDQEISDFVFDFEEDLLKEIIVKPKDNTLTKSNMSGNIGLSISTDKGINELNYVLSQCIYYYNKDDYKDNYPFIGYCQEFCVNKIL